MEIAICDDELEQCKLMATYCQKFKRGLSVSVYTAAFDLFLAFEKKPFDIVFMDIEMPSPNGFEIAERLRQTAKPPLIIFVTKSSTYTILGYGVAFRYIQKPIAYSTFETVLSLAMKEREPARISIVCDGVYHVIPVSSIVYCEALDHRLTIHTTAKSLTVRMSLSEMLSQLPSEDFSQPHKSFLVNLGHVQSVDATSVMLAWEHQSVAIPVSKGKRKLFIQKLGDYIGR